MARRHPVHSPEQPPLLARAAQPTMIEQPGQVRQRARIVTTILTQDFSNAFHHGYPSSATICQEFLIQRHVIGAASPTRSFACSPRDASGKQPSYGTMRKLKEDPYWRDHLLFDEYFLNDTRRGLGASHQTGWTWLMVRPRFFRPH